MSAGEVRREDFALLSGRGGFVADLVDRATLHLGVVRATVAHAAIGACDLREAAGTAGVVRSYDADEVSARVDELPVLWDMPGQKSHGYPVLATGRALYVGQPVAALVAESRYLAEDAIGLAHVEYSPLQPVPDVAAAERADSLLYPEWGDNVAVELRIETPGADEAMEQADRVVRRSLSWGRQAALPLEPRCALAEVDRASGRLTIWASTQAPHLLRRVIAQALHVPEGQIRVIAPPAGGSFGSKYHVYPEDVLVALAARDLGERVCFVEDRAEHVVATVHARQQTLTGELGVTNDGELEALRIHVLADVGAHLHTIGAGPIKVTLGSVCGPYRIEHFSARATCLVTNKTPYGSYRGFGAPQATWLMEALIDAAAVELDLDAATIRMRNLVTSEELPRTTPSGLVYDSGDYPAALGSLLAEVGYESLRTRQREAAAKPGRTRTGIGIAGWVHGTGWAPSSTLGAMRYDIGGYETATVRIDSSGGAMVLSGLAPQGQGTATLLAQLVSDELGIASEEVSVIFGDTDVVPASGMGHGADRGVAAGGTAVWQACQELKGKLASIGAHLLGDPLDAVVVSDGCICGSGGERVSVTAAAEAAWLGHRLPPGVAPGLEATVAYDPPQVTYSYGFQVAVADVDEETGEVAVRHVYVMSDCGTVLDRASVEAQIHGGVIQGMGDALMGEMTYRTDATPEVGGLDGYALPSLRDLPSITVMHRETPAPDIPTGAKGMAEGPIIGAPAAIALAVEDALRPLGGRVDRLPIRGSTLLLDRVGLQAPTGR